MSIYKKIQACRATIKASDLKKSGYNSFSNYPYYTPEQVDKLVYDACLGNCLFNKFELMRDNNGLYGQITVIDMESKEEAIFIAATEMPVITATNASQQMGGCMTFANRYLLMFIYNIVDNNLDFDAHDNTKKTPNKAPIQPQGSQNATQPGEKEKPWLNEIDKSTGDLTPEFIQAKRAIEQGLRTVKDLFKTYKVSKPMQEKLRKLEPINEEPPPINEDGLHF